MIWNGGSLQCRNTISRRGGGASQQPLLLNGKESSAESKTDGHITNLKLQGGVVQRLVNANPGFKVKTRAKFLL